MVAPFRIGLPSTIWLSSVGIALTDYFSALDFGLMGVLSWLVVLSGVTYFVRLIAS